MSGRHLVLVPHTHWDREWYQTHETFRVRLVHLLDDVLDLLERDPAFRHFTLDGQTIVLSDYLEVRPGARERIGKLVRDGRLLVGPWFVLPDEWLVSGEALIRNLRRGLADARALGPVMRIGYVPDQFGHVGQLPQLLAGFGCEGAILWRGVPAGIDDSLFWWEAPDGTRIFTVYLMHGYGNAVHLPLEPDALARRLRDEAERLAARSRIPSLLLMNGSDHALPQPGLPAALAAAVAQLPGTSAEIGTLPGFVSRARSEAPESLPVHRGELRSGLRAPLLEGCASARMPLKRADFLNDRLLTRYLEPLAAWLAALGGDADPAFLDLAWRIALENHPHDSICGCSIDAVHDQMETRFARVADVAQAHLRRVAAALARQVAAPETGFGRGAGRAVVTWNPHASGIGEAEGELELGLGARRSSIHLRDGQGRRIPAVAELVDAGEVAASYTMAASGVAILARGVPHEFMGLFVCGLSWGGGKRGRRVEVALGAEKPSGFDLEASKAELLAWLAAAGDAAVTFRALRLPRFRLRFVDRLPGCGLRVYRIARGPARATPALRAQRLPGGGAAIENEQVRLEARGDGRLRWIDRERGVVIEDALRLVSEGDRGDEYNFDPVPGGERVEAPARVRVKLGPVSEAEVSLAIDARYRVPAALAPGRDARARRRVWLPVRLRLRLSRGTPRVAVQIDVENTARDHRLRAHVRAPFAASRFEVESAFEIASRPIAPGPASFGSEHPSEFPIGATPQRGFATLAEGSRALTVANRGCAEVEAVREEGGTTSLALTLLRAVGWLSRGDLTLRPIHAGPALETPGAQGLGPHRVEFGFWLHADGDPERGADAHRFGAPAWLFTAEGGPHAPLRDGERLLEIDDPAVVVSAIEPRTESTPLIRLYNASGEARRVALRWRGPGARRLAAVDLAGNATRLEGFVPDEGTSATLSLRPWQIVNLSHRLTRPGSRPPALRPPCAGAAAGLLAGARLLRADCARVAQATARATPRSRLLPARVRRGPRADGSRGVAQAVKKTAAGPDEPPALTEFSRACSRGWRVVRARTAAHQARPWRLATTAVWLALAAPTASAAEPPGPPVGLAAAPVASDRLVLEEEWAADLVDLLALDRALPDAPRAEDYFSLLCAEQMEREVGTGGRSAPVGPLFEASADVPPPRRPGDPVRVVLSVPATALYSLSVEGVGLQRWVIDQEPVGHLDPTPLGVTWAAATTPLRAGPHEITGYFGPGARAERVSLTALRSLCIAPADGWHAQRPLSYGAKARTLVRAFGFEWRLPVAGDPIEIEGEAYASVSGGGGRTNRRVAVAASHDVWATASQSPAELSYRLRLEEPAVVTLEARVLGDAPQLWSVDGRYRAIVVPTGGREVFDWMRVLALPLGAGEHELRARIARHTGVDVLRATPRRSSDADYLSVLSELGMHVSAAGAFVTHSDALESLSSPVFVELSNRFKQRIEGDATERPIVLVDEAPEPRSVDRALSPMLPSEL